jgi:TetR/AcrR family fatty acid metabolism transcriptional regulator
VCLAKTPSARTHLATRSGEALTKNVTCSRHRQQRENAILEGALKVFGEKGFEAATVAAMAGAAGVSEATLYEYFGSKEEILFSIAELYTRREIERMSRIAPYIHGPREKLRLVIQAYLEFYESNPLYTSVALLTLKGSRSFIQSPSYETVREASRPIIDFVKEGMEQGVFRDDLDPYLVRSMVLGFIEHLTIQWLLLGRPERISEYRDTILDMIMRAIGNDRELAAHVAALEEHNRVMEDAAKATHPRT